MTPTLTSTKTIPASVGSVQNIPNLKPSNIKPDSEPNTNNINKALLGTLPQLAGGASQLVTALANKDYRTDYERVKPETVSAQPAINLARTQANRITAGTKASVRGNAKTAGELIAGNAAADAGLLDSTGEMLAKTRYGADMGNATIRNQGRYTNAQIAMQETNANDQNWGVGRTNMTEGVDMMGKTLASGIKYSRLYDADGNYKNKMGTLMDTEHYKYDPNTGERLIKSAAFGGKLKYNIKKK